MKRGKLAIVLGIALTISAGLSLLYVKADETPLVVDLEAQPVVVSLKLKVNESDFLEHVRVKWDVIVTEGENGYLVYQVQERPE